jgi:hypothetical protein
MTTGFAGMPQGPNQPLSKGRCVRQDVGQGRIMVTITITITIVHRIHAHHTCPVIASHRHLLHQMLPKCSQTRRNNVSEAPCSHPTVKVAYYSMYVCSLSFTSVAGVCVG